MKTLQDFIDAERRKDAADVERYRRELDQVRGNLNGWASPTPAASRTEFDINAAASVAYLAHVEFSKSPEGQFIEALAEADRLTVDLHRHLEDARNARSRSWVGELAHIEAAMSKVQTIARKITELAIDAQIECAVESKKLNKEPQA